MDKSFSLLSRSAMDCLIFSSNLEYSSSYKLYKSTFHQAYRLKGKNRWIIKQNEVSVAPFSSPSVRALYLVFSIPQQELSCASFLDAASVLTERKHIQYRQRDQSLQTIDSTAYFCLLSSTVFLWKDVHFTGNYRKTVQ